MRHAIIVEAMCVWLSGGLNKLKDMEDEQWTTKSGKKQCMTQKTAGQPEYAKKDDVRFETELDQLLNFIAIEALALWRSGKLGELKEPEDNGEPFKSDYHDMWDFLKPGNTKSNVPALIELCETLDGMMARNNAGQPMYEAGQKITIDDVINAIIVEAMCLWLSGGLEKLKEDNHD